MTADVVYLGKTDLCVRYVFVKRNSKSNDMYCSVYFMLNVVKSLNVKFGMLLSRCEFFLLQSAGPPIFNFEL